MFVRGEIGNGLENALGDLDRWNREASHTRNTYAERFVDNLEINIYL